MRNEYFVKKCNNTFLQLGLNNISVKFSEHQLIDKEQLFTFTQEGESCDYTGSQLVDIIKIITRKKIKFKTPYINKVKIEVNKVFEYPSGMLLRYLLRLNRTSKLTLSVNGVTTEVPTNFYTYLLVCSNSYLTLWYMNGEEGIKILVIFLRDIISIELNHITLDERKHFDKIEKKYFSDWKSQKQRASVNKSNIKYNYPNLNKVPLIENNSFN